jgi:hypothetical protein
MISKFIELLRNRNNRNYLKIMESTYTSPPPNKYEITKKFINCLDLLVGSDDRTLYGQVSQENIDAMI